MSPLFMRYLIWPLVKFLIAFLIVQVIVMLMNWIERRTLGLMQARLGPNRVGYKGILQIIALTSTGVYGIILGGWASNNKYSLMGGLRSAAQMVSYEVPFGLSIVGVLMLCRSFDLVHIVRYQETNAWNFLPQIVACFIFLVAMNAENNRTPFDLPEAESELVAGYHTEYSAMKFAFFMLAEYSAMLVNCCLMVSLFFGGWTLAMGD